MKTPRIVFALTLPLLSTFGSVQGVAHAAALPVAEPAPIYPRHYFPKFIKRQVNDTIPDVTRPVTTTRATTTTTGDLDDFISSLSSILITPTDATDPLPIVVPSPTQTAEPTGPIADPPVVVTATEADTTETKTATITDTAAPSDATPSDTTPDAPNESNTETEGMH